MASTRNINTPGNYCLQQKSYQESRQYTTYIHSAYNEAYKTQLPGDGLLPAQIPWNKMSENAVDIETFLYGIGSTNMVNPAPCFTPELKTLSSANIYQKSPTIIPEPLVASKTQRPWPI
jgi:hypothetical protein